MGLFPGIRWVGLSWGLMVLRAVLGQHCATL